MQDIFKKLHAALNDKIRVYTQLIQLMGEEWKSVSEYSREHLEATLTKKEALLIKAGEVNQQREVLVKALADQYNLSVKETTLRNIIGLRDNPLAGIMARQRQKIKEQIQTIQKMNQSNRKIIQRSSASMKQSLSWLYQGDVEYAPYRANGEIMEAPLESRMVCTSA